MGYSYLILGAGRQGTAAAYDLARFGEADRVTLADVDLGQAEAAARRVNALTGRSLVGAMVLDARDGGAVAAALAGRSVALSAVPYGYNLALTRAAIEAGVSFCDLGGNTEIVRQQHALDRQAKDHGVRVLPSRKERGPYSHRCL